MDNLTALIKKTSISEELDRCEDACTDINKTELKMKLKEMVRVPENTLKKDRCIIYKFLWNKVGCVKY